MMARRSQIAARLEANARLLRVLADNRALLTKDLILSLAADLTAEADALDRIEALAAEREWRVARAA